MCMSAPIRIMVAQMGPTSVGPVSSCAGVENPVWATTP
ncbi:ash family protein [Klebsiella quasipneumoniae]